MFNKKKKPEKDKAALKADKEAAKQAKAEKKAVEDALKAQEAAKKASEAQEAAKKAKEAQEAAQKAKEAQEAAKKAGEDQEAAQKARKTEAEPVPPSNAHLLAVIFGDPKAPVAKFVANRRTRKMFRFAGRHALEASSRGRIETESIPPGSSPVVWAYERKLVIHDREPGAGEL